ncbi:MAG TPA: DUF4175 family protein [Longimicrobiales bacterium]|nr:DUF4175 family protein [Longimicrobiales bacterium]
MTRAKGKERILGLVASVRRRWRLRVALQGLVLAGGVSLAVLFLSSLALEPLRFAPEAVLWLRVVTWTTVAASLVVFLVRPLVRGVTEQQVALYLEEHEPSLDHVVVSAMEQPDGAPSGLTRRLVDTALRRASEIEFGRRVERTGLYRFGGALTALAVVSLALALLGPAHLRFGLSALLLPTRDADTVNPYAISVAPGDVTIARGTDQLVTATLAGFEAGEASVFTRSDPDGSFQRLSMPQAEDGTFEALLLGIGERTEYFVESTGIRSPTYTIDVADLPYVDRLDLTYRFPSYTGLPPRTVENGGDVAALAGTVVEVRVTPTIPAPGGRLLLDGGSADELAVEQDGTLVGTFTVTEEGFYAVELARDDGELVAASPEYTIDVLADQPPSVRVSKPGRDMPASPIEEVYLEVGADDDYGIGDLRLVYSVNGGPEDTVSIFEGSGAPLSEVSAGHTLFLEEWELEPGDLVSYYALVRDNRGRRGAGAVSSDIYFLNVRPFDRVYREGGGQGGPPQGGGGQMPESALSELQRQIVAATFNLIRQRDSYTGNEFSENVVSVALTQGRLRQQVETLVERMRNRGLTDTDPGFRDVSEILPRAAEAMEHAKRELDEEDLREALPHEQTALRFLQQAEETYERYVVEQQAGGGGGGGQSAAADDLADLFELELDKLKNQYETVRRGQQQSSDDQVDEVLEKLEELSRRQQQAAQRQQRRAQQGAQGQQGGGGDAQRQLAEEAEEAARQLQRLARETGQPELEEAARRLQEAAESMRQSAAQSGNAGAAEASSALDRLEEARRRLRDNREDRARRDAENALRQVDELARQQRDVQREVRDLPGSGSERAQRIQRLRERKDQMTEAVQELERELDRASSVARGEQPDAARELKGAADQIRESKLKEKLQYSRGTIEQWAPEQANTLELNIEADLQALRERLEAAAGAAGERQADPLEEALEETRDLVRGMEAMDRRLRERTGADEQGLQPPAGEGREDQAAREGQPGEAGEQQGRPGQARSGQAGQEGRQGGNPAGVDGGPTEAREGSPFAGGPTRGNPRRLSDEEIRQFRREFLEREGSVRDLRDRLSAAGQEVGDLTAVLDAMRRLQQDPIYQDPAQVAALQEQILQTLKRLEFGLRREVEGTPDRRAALAGSGDVPDAYRKLVEEYYRKLAGSGGRPPGGP